MADAKFLGRYELMYLLGQGGMGEVHLARLTGAAGFEKLCIVKTILPQVKADPQFVDRFHHEARTLVQLNHSNIAQVYDMGEVDDILYMAIEYVPGVDLSRVEDRTRQISAPVPIPIAIAIAQQMCEALGYAHRKLNADGSSLGIVHRDISPQNVMVSYEGEVKVIDFGLAKSTARSKHTMPSTVLGKLGYMSPEQAQGKPVDLRSDLYSAGIVIWELLAGRPLFEGGTVGEMVAKMVYPEIPPVRQLRPEVSPKLEALVMKALSVDPAGRWSRGDDLSRALNELAVGEGLTVGAEEVGNFVRAMCPEEFAAERKLQSKLSQERKRGSSSPQVKPVPQEFAGTAIRESGANYATPNPKVPSQVKPPSQPRVPQEPAAETPAQKLVSGDFGQRATGVRPPSQPGPRGSVQMNEPRDESFDAPISVPKSKTPMVVAAIALLILVGGGGFAFSQMNSKPVEVAKVDPPAVQKLPELVNPGAKPVVDEKPVVADPAQKEFVEVKGELFKVIAKDGKIYAVTNGTNVQLKVNEGVRIVGEEKDGQRELLGDASVDSVEGVKAELFTDLTTLPPGAKGFVDKRSRQEIAEKKKKAPGAFAQAAAAAAKENPTPQKTVVIQEKQPETKEPERVVVVQEKAPEKQTPPPVVVVVNPNDRAAQIEAELAAKNSGGSAPAKAVTPTPAPSGAWSSNTEVMTGKVVRKGSGGLTIVNNNSYPWKSCMVLVPGRQMFQYPQGEKIEAQNDDGISASALRPNPYPNEDAVVAKGKYALLYCEGVKGYIPYVRN